MIRNRVISLRDVVEWTDVDPLPDGTQIFVEGGRFVLRTPTDGQPWNEIAMVSPDGTVWSMSVDNTGAWVSTSIQPLSTEAGVPLAAQSGDLLILE